MKGRMEKPIDICERTVQYAMRAIKLFRYLQKHAMVSD